jgi:hypothetical protein
MGDDSKENSRHMKLGDRLWISSAEPSSTLEVQIATKLAEFDQECRLFHVHVFSWRATPMPSAREVTTHLPRTAEFCQSRYIGLHEIKNETTVSVALPTLMFTDIARAGDIQLTFRKITFCHQLLVIVGCRHTDHEAGHASLRGAMDAVGFLSLCFGKRICEVPVISEYFDATKQKFVSSTLALTAESATAGLVYGIRTFYGLDHFDGLNDRVHAALWFAGKAFVETDRASKLVFLHTAIEVISGKSLQNYFRRLYSGKSFLEDALHIVRTLQQLRGKLLHQGRLDSLPTMSERYGQLLILDALVAERHGHLPRSALEAAIDAERPG